MSSISCVAKNIVNTSVHWLNQPLVKEGVKNIAGTVTFAFGLIEIYDFYQISQGRALSTEPCLLYPKWIQVTHKVDIVCAKISLILSAGVSRPGFFIISSLMGSVFSTSQLHQAFGPNTLFVVNPWHPRHIVSIVAVILALPSVLRSGGIAIDWTHQKIRQLQGINENRLGTRAWLTDTKIRLMNLFNIVTSRPVLHLGNQFGRFLLRRT